MEKKYSKILITGFEAFDGDSYNPSENYIASRKQFFSDLNIASIVLPVSFSRSFELVEKLQKTDGFDLIIQLGLAKNRTKISLEKVAINWNASRISDADDCVLKGKVIEEGPDGIFTSINLDSLLENLSDSRFEISFSAGNYVCNHLYYKTLITFKKTESLFVHLPGTKQLGDNYHWFEEELFLTIDKLIEKIIL